MTLAIRKHLPFILVATVLTLVMTFPTIVYVFKTDVFWLPAKHCCDVFIEFWDIWYAQQILSGKADLFYTNMIFYPDGVSLTYNQVGMFYSTLVIALRLFLPLSNAYSLAFLLIIISSAGAAYLYLNWLLKDRWLALFGAVVFGMCRQVVTLTSWPQLAWLAPVPLALYFIHRGFKEKRSFQVIVGAIIAGLTSEFTAYTFVCIVMVLVLFVAGLAVSRWRDRGFWGRALLLMIALTLACAWRVVPMLLEAEQMDRAIHYTDGRVDLLSFFVNRKHPVLVPFAQEIFNIPEKPKITNFMYIGLAPIACIGFGLVNRKTRRRMSPWLGLLLLFMVLSLGSTLGINGIEYPDIKLPKHYLNQLLPTVFAAFFRPDLFMTGAWLPLAVLSCLGLAALLQRIPTRWRSRIILAFAAFVAFEYYSPIPELAEPQLAIFTTDERLAFLDWLELENEEQSDIRLINLPFGHSNTWRYSFFQALSGYPQVEGYLSRRPGSAYGYINANVLLDAWHWQRPIHCDITDKETFLAGLAQLEQDGFSHVVHHRDIWLYGAQRVGESFRGVTPAYQDEFVSIYRLGDLRAGCPEALSDRHRFTSAFADALTIAPIPDDRHGTLVILPPTPETSDHFRRYLRHFSAVDRNVVVVTGKASGQVDAWHWPTRLINLESQNAVWFLKDRLGFAPNEDQANYVWFLERFKYCEPIYADATVAVDLYVRPDIPCSALSSSSALEIRYLDGLNLHNASVDVNTDKIHFYFAWTNRTTENYSFSIQLFDEGGQRALQYDSVIQPELLARVEIDAAQLTEGQYLVKLIVYEFDTGKSLSGTVQATMAQFEREFELATIRR